MIKTITDLRRLNQDYFSRANKIIFQDISYRLLTSRTKIKYLVTHTYKWSDMFGDPKKPCYVLKPISIDGKIGSLIDLEFKTLQQVKDYLKNK